MFHFSFSRILYGCVDWNKMDLINALKKKRVASFTDAWIETWATIARNDLKSRILYGCVDWNFAFRLEGIPWRVASFTDAWIETKWKEKESLPNQKSHPLRMRGLKLYNDTTTTAKAKSHPLRMRGLKLNSGILYVLPSISRILYGCVDWNRALLTNSRRKR